MLARPKATAAQSMSRTVQATLGTQTQTVSLDGTLSPSKQSDVNFAVSGTITEVYVKAGEKVDKGDKLARVDDTDLQDALDVADANLATAQANYDEVVDNDGSSAAIASAKAQVSSAKAARTSAKQDLANAVLRSPSPARWPRSPPTRATASPAADRRPRRPRNQELPAAAAVQAAAAARPAPRPAAPPSSA